MAMLLDWRAVDNCIHGKQTAHNLGKRRCGSESDDPIRHCLIPADQFWQPTPSPAMPPAVLVTNSGKNGALQIAIQENNVYAGEHILWLVIHKKWLTYMEVYRIMYFANLPTKEIFIHLFMSMH